MVIITALTIWNMISCLMRLFNHLKTVIRVSKILHLLSSDIEKNLIRMKVAIVLPAHIQKINRSTWHMHMIGNVWRHTEQRFPKCFQEEMRFKTDCVTKVDVCTILRPGYTSASLGGHRLAMGSVVFAMSAGERDGYGAAIDGNRKKLRSRRRK